jgi:hypothetical protein
MNINHKTSKIIHTEHVSQPVKCLAHVFPSNRFNRRILNCKVMKCYDNLFEMPVPEKLQIYSHITRKFNSQIFPEFICFYKLYT